ncbi:MAG: epoxyqueuosine reductase [Chloroflexi bacterium]|nr:epoxyqueuosine reductase [Chloroflexota bacterium]
MLSSAELKEFARGLRLDLIGIAEADNVPTSHPPRTAAVVLPEARSVIVYGLALFSGVFHTPITRVAFYNTLAVDRQLEEAGYQIARFIERHGHVAVIVPSAPLEMSKETRGLVADISLKQAGVTAGLGVWGRSHLLVTPQWGPRVRLGGIVSDAPLEADRPRDEDLCRECTLCIDSCPAAALAPEGKVDVIKCLLHLQKHGLAAFSRFLADLLAKPEEEQKKSLRDPYFWNLYQTIRFGGTTYDCYDCARVCPAGCS